MTFADMTALELGRSFEEGRADPREVTEDFLERAGIEDPDRRIYVRLLEKRARAEAEAAADRAERGLRRHALDGVPLSWKDLFDVAGEPTAAGSLPLKSRVPQTDAEVLARATRGGAVCLGKTTMTELAFPVSASIQNSARPQTRMTKKSSECPAALRRARAFRSRAGLRAAPSAPIRAARCASLPPGTGWWA